MNDEDLLRRLKRLRRTVLMLDTEFRRTHVDTPLLLELDHLMEDGIAADPRCAGLRDLVDALRESTLTPRPELHADAVRCCEKLKDAIEDVVDRVR